MRTPSTLTRPTVLISVALLALAIILLVLSQEFGRSSGMFPRFIGWVFVALAAADVLVQLGRWYQQSLPEATETSTTVKQLKAMGWLFGLVVFLFVFGFLITIPLYIFVFLTWRSGHDRAKSAAISLGALFFVWIIFVWLLDYELYVGLILERFL
ncbi:tripartite tricarboxylate transporter TctB family protein [Saccharospirillum sp.]|uniref:tripartite tricarboxylate transporter TctB family protein n=1 Tax=Saccharospirillum sp. TaxID=2033801 RepID=UPI0034A08577